MDAGGHFVRTQACSRVGGGEMGKGPLEGTGEDGEVKRCWGEVVGSRCREGPLLGVGGIWGEGDGVGEGVEGVDYGECPLSRDEIESAVRRALGKTKNGSAPGPDGVGYQVIRAVWDTRHKRGLIEEIVDNVV